MSAGRLRALLAAVVVLAALAYLPVLGAPYHFDDFSLFTDPVMQADKGLAHLFDLERTRPLTYFSYWLSFRLGGARPALDHGVNLALFLVLIVVVASAYRRVLGPEACLAAVTVFALHPLATEATAYVFARATLLATLFAVCAWRAWVGEKRWLAVGLFAAAMAAKEEAAGLPLFLCAYELVYRRETRAEWRAWSKPLLAMAAIVALSAARLIYAIAATPGSGAGFAMDGVSPVERLGAQGAAVWVYLRLFVAPFGLNVDHDFSPSPVAVWLAWPALAVAAAACLWLVRRRPAWFWILGGLLLLAPSTSFIPLADPVAERRMLLPMVSLAAGAGTLLAGVLGGGRRLQIAAALLALTLAGFSWQRCLVWADAETLWSDAVRKSPQKVRPRLQLARALDPHGTTAFDQRERLIHDATALDPDDSDAASELGMLYLAAHRPDEAFEALSRAAQLSPSDPQIRANLGVAEYLRGDVDAAQAAFEQALRLDPCNFDARNNLILIGRSQGDSTAAARLAQTSPGDCNWSREQHAAMRAAQVQ